MHLFTLPTTIPWLSLLWLSLLVPALVIACLGQRTAVIRIVGTTGAALSLLLALLLYGAYDPAAPARFQFVEELPWLPQLGIGYTLGVDGISLPMLLLNGLVVTAAALVSWNVEERAREYWVLLLLVGAGVYGVFVALDLFLLFVFYELVVLPIYLLIGVWGSVRREYGATKLTLYLMGGSAAIILGMVALYFGSAIRTFDLRVLAQAALFSPAFQVIWFVPLFLGFAVLASIFPFHSWSPIGYAAAPTAASMMHAGVLKNLGAYGCLRVAMWLLPDGANAWLLPLAITTLIGAVYGAAIAATQRDLKFMLGYSSVSHMGLTLMGLAAANELGLQGAVLQMFAHGVMTALFFAVVGRMVYERTHTRQLPELGGLFAALPFAGVVGIIAGLSSMGMPGLAGFFAEFNIFLGMWQRYPLVAIVAALMIPITAGYVLRALYGVFFGETRNADFLRLPKLTWQEYVAGAMLAAVLVIAGLAPSFLTEPISSGVRPVAAALQRAGEIALTK